MVASRIRDEYNLSRSVVEKYSILSDKKNNVTTLTPQLDKAKNDTS
jgi:hypothetical protein